MGKKQTQDDDDIFGEGNADDGGEESEEEKEEEEEEEEEEKPAKKKSFHKGFSKKGRSERGELVSLTGLFKNEKSMSGKTNKKIRTANGSVIQPDTRFLVLKNKFAKKESDPPYKLFIAEDSE